MIDIKTTEEFEAKVLKSDKLVIVDFFAVWCGPCKMVSPIIESVSEEYKGTCDVYKLETEKLPEIAAKYKVMMVPSILFFKNGNVIDTIVGAVPKSEIESKIEQYK